MHFRKLYQNKIQFKFLFSHLFEAFEAFIKPFEAPQRSVKIKT